LEDVHNETIYDEYCDRDTDPRGPHDLGSGERVSRRSHDHVNPEHRFAGWLGRGRGRHGFQDDETLYALECVNDGAATNQTDCDTNTVSLAQSSATGTFSASVTVVTGVIAGTTTCGTTSADLSSCAIVVSTNPRVRTRPSCRLPSRYGCDYHDHDHDTSGEDRTA